jgi:hypothetical protein
MPELKKSDVMENVLTTLINISGRKTNKGHALFTMDNLIKRLEDRYNLLKNVQIKDIRYSEDEDAISIMTGIDDAESAEVGKAIHDIITTMNRDLGRDAGHFFIKELRTTLDAESISLIEDMGVDLGLMQLEYEVGELEKRVTQKK